MFLDNLAANKYFRTLRINKAYPEIKINLWSHLLSTWDSKSPKKPDCGSSLQALDPIFTQISTSLELPKVTLHVREQINLNMFQPLLAQKLNPLPLAKKRRKLSLRISRSEVLIHSLSFLQYQKSILTSLCAVIPKEDVQNICGSALDWERLSFRKTPFFEFAKIIRRASLRQIGQPLIPRSKYSYSLPNLEMFQQGLFMPLTAELSKMTR